MTVRKLATDVDAVCAASPTPPASSEPDPLLAAIRNARARRQAADDEMRLLIAYGRRFVYPHPYTLAELATAANLSISGVRTAFDTDDVQKVSLATGLEPAPAPTEGEDN